MTTNEEKLEVGEVAREGSSPKTDRKAIRETNLMQLIDYDLGYRIKF